MSFQGMFPLLFYLGMACGPVAAALFRVWVHQDAIEMGYRLSQQEQRGERLRTALRALEVEAAVAHSPAHLVRLAAQLGLHPPRTLQRVRTLSTSRLAQAPGVKETYGRP